MKFGPKTSRSVLFISITLIGSSCKLLNSSKTKSFVGIQSEVDQAIAKGEAPSFLLLQQWFAGTLPKPSTSDSKIKYQFNHEFSNTTWSRIPPEYRDSMIKYYQQQVSRIVDLQASLKEPEKLKAILELEALEMYDIIRALIEPGYAPKSNDLLALLFSQSGLRNYVDQFSGEILTQLYEQKDRDQHDLLSKLDAERVNFGKLLIKTYVTSSGANAKFVSELQKDCSTLNNFIKALGSSPALTCRGSSSLQLSGTPDVSSASERLTGSGKKFAEVFAGVFAEDGPASDGDSAPKLSLFSTRDLSQGDSAQGNNSGNSQSNNNDGQTTPQQPSIPSPQPQSNPQSNPSTPGRQNQQVYPQNNLLVAILNLLLGPGWANQVPGVATKPGSLNISLSLSSNYQSSIPPKASFSCKEEGYKGMDLVLCQRYFAVLPTASSLISTNHGSQLASDHANDTSLALNGGYNFSLVTKSFTAVQNQGKEGACSAYGAVHTLIADMQKFSRGFTYSASALWADQGMQPYMSASVEALQNIDLNGRRVVGSVQLKGVSELKRVIDQGRAVYASSEVDKTWYKPKGTLSCGSKAANAPGHAYSIQGYDDDKQVFIVKNSWGSIWGEYGYYYLPYKCISQFKQAEFQDLQIK